MKRSIVAWAALCALAIAAAPAAARLTDINVVAVEPFAEDGEQFIAKAKSEEVAKRFSR